MDNHLQHPQTAPTVESAQRVPVPSRSARIAMDALTAPGAQNPSSTSSSYIESFTQIAALQAKGDHFGLIQAAERVDLAVCLPLSYRAC